MIPERTRNAIISKCGKKTIPRVAEQYGVSKNTVRHIWAEAKEGKGKHSPWYVPWLDPKDEDEGEQDANLLKMLQIAWYYKHGKAGLVRSQESDYSRAYDVITSWDLLSEKAKRTIFYIMEIDAFPENHSHEDGTPWTFEEWNKDYESGRYSDVYAVFRAELEKTDDYKLHYPEVYQIYKGEIEFRPPFWTLEHFRKYRNKANKYGKKQSLSQLFNTYGRAYVPTRDKRKGQE